MTDCVFDDRLTCVHCGYIARREGTRRNCSRPETPAGPFDRLSRYAAAVARWIRAGRPVRTDAEVEGLLAICAGCDHFRNGTCSKCGCAANRSASGWSNKLRMATETCPIGLWGASQPAAKARPRVGFVLPNLVRGGVESWLASLIRGLQADGRIDIAGVAFTGGPGTLNDAVAAQIDAPIVGAVTSTHVHRVASPAEAIYAVAQGSDVLVVWSLDAAGRDACRAVGRPLVGVSHGCADWWMREAVDLIDHWVAVSQAAASPVPSDRVAIIWNGIDIDRTRVRVPRDVVRQQARIPADAELVVSIGRLSQEKRLDRIVRSAELWPANRWLWLVGDGLERQALQAIAGPRVVISPSVTDVGSILGAADAFAFASEAEGYGLAPVEALAAGVPLASTRVGILPDIDEQLGRPCAVYLPDDPSPRDIAAGVDRALQSWQAPAGVLRTIAEHHSQAAMARRWAEYLGDLCRSAAPH